MDCETGGDLAPFKLDCVVSWIQPSLRSFKLGHVPLDPLYLYCFGWPFSVALSTSGSGMVHLDGTRTHRNIVHGTVCSHLSEEDSVSPIIK
jgi:hypothetical protein